MEGYCWPQALTRKHFWESRDALEMRGPFHFCLQKKGPGLYALMVSLSKLFDTLFSCFTWCHDLLCLQFLFLFFKKVSYLIRKETEGGRRYTFSQRMNLRIVSMCQQLWELININYLPISIKTCSGSVTILGSQLYSIWRLPMKQHMNPRPREFTLPGNSIFDIDLVQKLKACDIHQTSQFYVSRLIPAALHGFFLPHPPLSTYLLSKNFWGHTSSVQVQNNLMNRRVQDDSTIEFLEMGTELSMHPGLEESSNHLL